MPYYFDGIKCDTLTELDALQRRKAHTAHANRFETKAIVLTDEEAVRIALAGEPKYPPRSTHPEDSHDDEADHQNNLRRWEHAKKQVMSLAERCKPRSTHPGRPIGDGDND